MAAGIVGMGKGGDKVPTEGAWSKAKRWLTSSIAENRKRKKDDPRYGSTGKGSPAYIDAQRELEKEYDK